MKNFAHKNNSLKEIPYSYFELYFQKSNILDVGVNLKMSMNSNV